MQLPIRLLLYVLLFLSAWYPVRGQQTLRFSFEHNGITYNNCAVQVKLVEDFPNKEVQLVFSNPTLGSNEPGSGLKMVVKDDCITLSSNNLQLQEAPPRGLTITREYPAKRRLNIIGTGKALIRIDKLYCRSEDGSDDRLVRLNSPAIFEFEIGGAAPPPPKEPDPVQQQQKKQQKPPPTPQPVTPKPAEDPAVVAYKAAMAMGPGKDRERALQKYVDNFPKAGNVKEAKKLVELGFVPLAPEGDRVVYRIRYALCAPQFDTAQFVGVVEPANDGSSDYLLKLAVNRGESYEVALTDPCKAEKVRTTNLFISGNPLKCVLTVEEDNFVLKFSGGSNAKAPFIVEYLKDGMSFPRGFETIESTDRTYSFPIVSIREKTETSGIFAIQVREDNLILPVEGNVFVPPPPPVWPYLVAALALALGVFFYSAHRKKMRKKAVEAKVKKKEDTPQEEHENWVPLQPPGAGSAMKIRSTARPEADHKAMSESEFDALLQEERFHALHMKKHWPDTVLTDIYLSPSSIRGISEFLHEQRKTMVEEEEGSIPEIGGFLLGKYCVSESSGKYRVAMTDFVPIVPEENNVYQLQFSTESLVRELGDMQDKYPDRSLVGWFHTHPGHGLFLSRPDLTIHNGFFREKYQFAMEIDTLTAHLDTGFFTRTTAGPVNNTETQAPELSWFKWSDIEQQNKP